MEDMGKVINRVYIDFLGVADNVAMARITVATLASQLDPTIDDLEEIKVATSEAVSNAIIHGYGNRADGWVRLEITIYPGLLEIVVEDNGCGIADIEQAMEPTFSSDPERMGLGFVFMKSFMDRLDVKSTPGSGTRVTMVKRMCSAAQEYVVEN